MKISHEVPICMLEKSREWNDYDYALVHLFESHPDYYNFFKESLEMGREVILDNSLYELGKSFDSEKYENWIRKLKPTYYIIPDVFNESSRSISLTINWLSKYKDLESKSIAVCHGKNFNDMVRCYNYYNVCGIDKIAFSFMEKAFRTFKGNVKNDDINMSIGRINFLKKMIADNIINVDKKHHLLGCYCPQEFSSYKSYEWIDSIDTSNPIMAGINNIKYANWGLHNKPEGKLVDHIDKDVENLSLIEYNIIKFKEIVI